MLKPSPREASGGGQNGTGHMGGKRAVRVSQEGLVTAGPPLSCKSASRCQSGLDQACLCS